jgi:endonuclease YncB( thermonuclease family)
MWKGRCLRSVCVCWMAVLAAGEVLSPRYAQAPPRGSGPRTVTTPVRVIEADTLEVFIDGKRVGVAIAGIAGPPGNTPCGRQAAAAVQALVAEGLELEEDLGLPAFDRRLLRVYRVFDRRGLSIAEELARRGFAIPDERAAAALDRPAIVAAAAEASGRAAGCVAAISR